jgi:hypothetical protein
MKLHIVTLIVIIVVMSSCKPEIKHEPPLAVVVKYIAAEMKGLTKEARLYIDVGKVYSKHIQGSDVDYEKVWEEQMTFRARLSNEKKINSCQAFYDFNIEEVMKNKTEATVIFTLKKQSKRTSVYDLELTDQGWRIVGINYSGDDNLMEN